MNHEKTYDVFIAIPKSNFQKKDTLCNYMDMVYASTDKNIAMRCLDSNRKDVVVLDASIPCDNIGYMPLTNNDYDPNVTVYVDNINEPKIFLINHRNIYVKKNGSLNGKHVHVSRECDFDDEKYECSYS